MGVWLWPMAVFTDSDSCTQATDIAGVVCAPMSLQILSWLMAFCAPNILI